MTTTPPTPEHPPMSVGDALVAEHAYRVRANVESAAGRFFLRPREIGDAIGIKSLEVVRRRRRGEHPWSLDELSKLVALIRTRPGGEDFDLADLTRPLE